MQTDWKTSEKLPRSVCVAVAGLACLPIGLLWDISHHSTIGRDTFWTPAHILTQVGGLVPALLFAAIAFKTTFRGTPQERDASVSFWGARAPLGVWVTIWGALAMLTSAPFDDWWHNRYGLDVKIASPPHAVLGLGMFAVGMGVLLFLFSSQNRASDERRSRSGWICALTVGVLITLWADFTTEFTWPNLQHGARFYWAVCTPFPLLLVLAARASKVPAAATVAAVTYMALNILMILVLPLFPAHPKLAPIYHPVDHMVPPAFPLLLILPAAAIDGIEWLLTRRRRAMAIESRTESGSGARTSVRRSGWAHSQDVGKLLPAEASVPAGTPALADSTLQNQLPPPRECARGGWWHDWVLSLVVAAVFLGIVFGAQWYFSAFLLSAGADNRFFARSGHWPYFVQPGDWMNSFWDLRKDPLTTKGIALAFLRAFISTRIGLWLGNYLLRLKR